MSGSGESPDRAKIAARQEAKRAADLAFLSTARRLLNLAERGGWSRERTIRAISDLMTESGR